MLYFNAMFVLLIGHLPEVAFVQVVSNSQHTGTGHIWATVFCFILVPPVLQIAKVQMYLLKSWILKKTLS